MPLILYPTHLHGGEGVGEGRGTISLLKLATSFSSLCMEGLRLEIKKKKHTPKPNCVSLPLLSYLPQLRHNGGKHREEARGWVGRGGGRESTILCGKCTKSSQARSHCLSEPSMIVSGPPSSHLSQSKRNETSTYFLDF